MTWPQEIIVSGIPIKITRAKQAVVAEASEDESADGTVDLVNLEVLYSEDLRGFYKDVIIYHEILHILEYILFAGHVDLGEKVIQAISLASREIAEQLIEVDRGSGGRND